MDGLAAIPAYNIPNDPPEPAEVGHLLPGHVQTDVHLTVGRVEGEQHFTVTAAQPERVEPDRPGKIGILRRRLVLKEPDQVRDVRKLHIRYVIGNAQEVRLAWVRSMPGRVADGFGSGSPGPCGAAGRARAVPCSG